MKYKTRKGTHRVGVHHTRLILLASCRIVKKKNFVFCAFFSTHLHWEVIVTPIPARYRFLGGYRELSHARTLGEFHYPLRQCRRAGGPRRKGWFISARR